MSNVTRIVTRDSRTFGAHNWKQPGPKDPPRRRPLGRPTIFKLPVGEDGKLRYQEAIAGAEPIDRLPYVCAVQRGPYLSVEVRAARAAKALKRQLGRALDIVDWSEANKGEGRGAGTWAVNDEGVRIEAARRAESPVIGERWQAKVLPREVKKLTKAGELGAAHQLETDGKDVLYVEARNNVDRWQKRQARQNGGACARRRRRGF